MRYALIVLLASVSAASAQYQGQSVFGTGSNPNSHYVQPTITTQGQYRPGHYQTNPNNTQTDNYGTRPNINPYTGQTGTRSSYR